MIFTIEGLDGTGKETQSKLLLARLRQEGRKAEMISFPNYNTTGCSMVEAYLNGDFGSADEVNAYQASAMFAMDRLYTYHTKMKPLLADGSDIVCDRYVESNLLYQSAKIAYPVQRNEYVEWQYDFEYHKLALPMPDRVFFLALEYESFQKLLKKRGTSKHSGKDIHESDSDFLNRVYVNALQVAENCGWEIIICNDKDGNLMSRKAISERIWKSAKELL